MRVFSCTDHAGFYPVGVASVIFAEDELEAIRLLDIALEAKGLQPYNREPYHLVEMFPDQPGAFILDDGNY